MAVTETGPRGDRIVETPVALAIGQTLAESPIVGLLAHRNFRPLFTNGRFADLHDRRDPSEIMAMGGVEGLFSREALAIWRAAAHKVMTGGNPVLFDYVQEGRGGPRRNLSAWMAPIPDLGDNALLCSVRDVSDRIADERALSAALATAEAASLAKTRFLAAASHDLRQPLQALNLFVDLLAAQPKDEKQEMLTQRIQDSLQSLGDLLDSLLDISKLDAGLVTVAPVRFPVANTIRRLAQEFQPMAAANGLTFGWVPCGLSVRSDPVLLERLLRNLLTNALRYTPKGRVLLGCRRRGQNLSIEVWDTGVGIPETEREAIFAEFHQLDNEVRDRRKGLGLGLAIVKRLGLLLDHPISVSSRVGQGSVFAVSVPIVAGAVAMADRGPMSQRTPRAGIVLVIENDLEVMEALRLALGQWGHQVIAATSIAGAIAELGNGGPRPQLIISDYSLEPGFSGVDAIRTVFSRLAAPVPAILLTGDTSPERLKEVQASGFHLVHKPIRPNELRGLIDRYLTLAP